MEQQRTEEWLKKRKNRITGSNIGAILGLSPYRTKDDVLRAMAREYQGLPSEFEGNIATEHGVRFEPMATKDLELALGQDIIETGFHEFEDWLGASPDGLVGDDYVVEIKCPYSKRDIKAVSGFSMLSEQPHYYAQVQFEMYCTNRTKAFFYQWSPSGAEMLEEIERDEQFINDALPKLKEFYELYLQDRDNNAHGEPLKKQLDDEMSLSLADRYKVIKQLESELAEEKKEIINKLTYLSNGENAAIGDMNLTHVFKQGAISYASAIKKLAPKADLEPYRGKPSEYWLLK